MRLRNIPGSDEIINKSIFAVNEPVQYKGRWCEVFNNSNPIHIEVGMGKGRFIMDMARIHRDINYIGIEMYSSVLLRAVEKAERLREEDSAPDNFRFIRMDARNLSDVFEKGEVDRIYLNFSDPWPKDRHSKRRLTSVEFLKRYEQILLSGSNVEFKTDNRGLFNFSLAEAKRADWEITAFTYDLHNDKKLNAGNVMTEYEEKFSSLGTSINKMIIKMR